MFAPTFPAAHALRSAAFAAASALRRRSLTKHMKQTKTVIINARDCSSYVVCAIAAVVHISSKQNLCCLFNPNFRNIQPTSSDWTVSV